MQGGAGSKYYGRVQSCHTLFLLATQLPVNYFDLFFGSQVLTIVYRSSWFDCSGLSLGPGSGFDVFCATTLGSALTLPPLPDFFGGYEIYRIQSY